MKKIRGVLILFKNLTTAFFQSIKNVNTNEDCFWTINETFFNGTNAKENRDNFQKDYEELVNRYRANFLSKNNN